MPEEPLADPDTLGELLEELLDATPEELASVVEGLPPGVIAQLLSGLPSEQNRRFPTPLDLAAMLDESYQSRAHLRALSDAVAEAVKSGESAKLIVEMPPRTGKTYLATQIATLWALSEHPEWKIALTSHDSTLTSQWGRQVRRWIEAGRAPGVKVAADAGAVKEWETTQGGGVLSRSLRESFTGRGAQLIVIDDPHKDFADAHSEASRDAVWNWWLTVAQTRLEPPGIVIVIMTRWHADDLVGRLLSPEYPGDPSEWRVLRFPAIAEEDDELGRAVGQPLYSPLLEETEAEALERWQSIRSSVGSYSWSALYQQRPAPAKGAIFNTDWWRFWTTDPDKATEDGKIIYLDPDRLEHAEFLDSWDFTFKGTESSDYVVGQRWAMVGADRFLLAQQRGRWDFPRALEAISDWIKPTSPYGKHVHVRVVEDAANGPAIISKVREKVSGVRPWKPRTSKEARARAVTPEIESGNVYLPLGSDFGNEWVTNDLLPELREFPTGVHDDQVDAMTMALLNFRPDRGIAHISNPDRVQRRSSLITSRSISR